MPKNTPLKHQGNESLFTAVEMSLISSLAGVPLHIHAEGLRGTGKTTVMRWAKTVVPTITRYKGCPYHCHPDRPHCPLHSGAGSPSADMIEEVPMPFTEIGHGAKLGTILGSIDLEKLTDPNSPKAAVLPGTIPMANRGVIFIDEVNRLAETAPEITDVLLSVMGTKPGRVKIEEVGLTACEVEVTASVWAASNPDEEPGPLEDIRRQLADRFDMVVPVKRPQDPDVIERLLFRGGEAEKAPEPSLSDIRAKADRLANVTVPKPIVRYMAQLYVHRNVESLRAIEALELCSRLSAAIAGKDAVTFDEVLAVIPLVLRHRVEPLTLSEILKDLELRRAAGSQADLRREVPPPESGEQEPTQAATPAAPENTSDLSSPTLPERAAQVPDGETASSDNNGNAGSSSAAPQPERQGWLQQALARYRDSVRRRSGRSGSGSTRGGAGRGDGASRSFVTIPNPKDVLPVSPPERANRLSSLPWEQLVEPPEWKDLLP